MARLQIVCVTLALLMVASATVGGDGVYRGEGPMMATPGELQWQPVPSMGEGAEIAIIEGDPSEAGPFTFRLRLDDGYRILPHTHPADERVTVLQGTLHFAHGRDFDEDATRRLGVGGVAMMPAGHPMYGYVERETILQLHGTGPWGIEYIDPEDDPRNR